MAKPLVLDWGTCGKDQHWCDLEHLTLPLKNNQEGVYIIWIDSDPPATVRVGQGDISDRLANHRKDKKILDCLGDGQTLRVTWATAPKSQWDGI